MPGELEQRRRLIKLLAGKIATLLADGSVTACSLSVNVPIQPLNQLAAPARAKITSTLALDLTKTDPAELLAHFARHGSQRGVEGRPLVGRLASRPQREGDFASLAKAGELNAGSLTAQAASSADAEQASDKSVGPDQKYWPRLSMRPLRKLRQNVPIHSRILVEPSWISSNSRINLAKIFQMLLGSHTSILYHHSGELMRRRLFIAALTLLGTASLGITEEALITYYVQLLSGNNMKDRPVADSKPAFPKLARNCVMSSNGKATGKSIGRK